jgi:hypothetical protein
MARQTFRRFPYQPARVSRVLMTFNLGTAPTGIAKRVGAFDSADGLFLEVDSIGPGFVIRSSTGGFPSTNTKVRQSDWALDKLDGTGPSGIVLDLTESQLMVIDYQWFGVGTIRWGFVIDGALRYAHVSYTSNLTSVVYIKTPNLPLRFEIENDGTGVAASMSAICTAILSEGGVVEKGTPRSLSRDVTPFQTADSNALYPILAVRKQLDRPGVVFRPQLATVIATTTAVLEWKVLLNPAVVGTGLSFSAINGSYMDGANLTNNSTTVTPTVTLASGYATDQTSSVASLVIPDFDLGETLDGIRDIFVLAARRVTGAIESIYASLLWLEYT